MLQQTRVDQAIPFYYRFLEAFPTVQALAEAERQDVLRLWEGLGYYSRARNLQDAARQVSDAYNGNFPSTYEQIIALKGIGPYTAAAISSIAFNLPFAVVDGNVIRVLARWSGLEEDVSKPATKKNIQQLADKLIDPDKPADFNQAIMELGATICTPYNPECNACPISASCVALQTLKTDQIPYKAKKKKVPHHDIVVGICVNDDGKVLIALRPEDKMLGGLWEFPGGKVEKDETFETALIRELKEELGVDVSIQDEKLIAIKHTYSHFKITLHAYFCSIESGTPAPKASKVIKWVDVSELSDYPFPKANRTLTQAIQQFFKS